MHHHHGILGGASLTNDSTLLKIAMAIAASSIVIKELLFRATRAIGQKINSQVRERERENKATRCACLSVPCFVVAVVVCIVINNNNSDERMRGSEPNVSMRPLV